jgi:DNA-binding protein YbaB
MSTDWTSGPGGHAPSWSGAAGGAMDTEAVRRRVTDLRTGMAEVHAAHYRGSDRDGLATVTVDGTGLLTELRLVPTIARHDAERIAAAVRDAMAAANQQRRDALLDFLRASREGWAGTGAAPEGHR